ncbi:hypothetical protein [Marinomonas transparens]|uniref:Short chain dehydrogenase n=1 Tax=Marinomonas transparens TaxID=2795388 RepID=A0A934JTS7_9GAMM|nr:hypothetical protein [Marinomonas transparens]MBJ7537230.1 hypothetical protein [Marinomonas transparens]
MSSFYALIVGASSTIAQSSVQQFEDDTQCLGILAVSRTIPKNALGPKTSWFVCDNTEQDIDRVSKELFNYTGKITKVLICNGILHDEKMMPERKLEEISTSQLQTVFHANSIIPMLWLRKV